MLDFYCAFLKVEKGSLCSSIVFDYSQADKRLEAFSRLVFGMALCHFREKETLKGFPTPVVDLFETVKRSLQRHVSQA